MGACQTCTGDETTDNKRNTQRKARGEQQNLLGVNDDDARGRGTSTAPLSDEAMSNLLELYQSSEMVIGTPVAKDVGGSASFSFPGDEEPAPVAQQYGAQPMYGAQAHPQAQPQRQGSAVDALLGGVGTPVASQPQMTRLTSSKEELEAHYAQRAQERDEEDDSSEDEMQDQMRAFQQQIQKQMSDIDKDTSKSEAERKQARSMVRQESLYRWSHEQMDQTKDEMMQQLMMLQQMGGGSTSDTAYIQQLMLQRDRELIEAQASASSQSASKKKKKKKKAKKKKKKPEPEPEPESESEHSRHSDDSMGTDDDFN